MSPLPPRSRTTRFNSPFEVKHLEASGYFTGYASTYGVDSQKDQIMPGAFTHTLQQWEKKDKLPLLLWHHRIEEPIGFWHKMTEDQKGLYVEGQLILDLQRAREAYILLKTKMLEGLSIGFQTVISKFDTRERVLKIYQVNLVEISIVSLPANKDALVHSVKNHEPNTQPQTMALQ
jgi:HK97 family phage prohead protease